MESQGDLSSSLIEEGFLIEMYYILIQTFKMYS